MKYIESPASILFEEGEFLLATHKGVIIEIGLGNDWVSIYAVESTNPSKGEVQEAIIQLKKDYPDKKLYSSTPLNPVMKHILDKFEVPYEV